MKKILTLILITLLFFSVGSYGQQKDTIRLRKIPGNSLYIELLGNVMLIGSVNYERVIVHKNNFYLTGRVGASFLTSNKSSSLMFPVLINGLFQLTNNFLLEVGLGTSLNYVTSIEDDANNPGETRRTNSFEPTITGVLGIRVQLKKGFLFRAGITPIYNIDKSSDENRKTDYVFLPWLGLSFGYSFGK